METILLQKYFIKLKIADVLKNIFGHSASIKILNAYQPEDYFYHYINWEDTYLYTSTDFRVLKFINKYILDILLHSLFYCSNNINVKKSWESKCTIKFNDMSQFGTNFSYLPKSYPIFSYVFVLLIEIHHIKFYRMAFNTVNRALK